MGLLNRPNKYVLSAMTVTTFAVGFGLCAHRRPQVYVTTWLGDRRAALSITYDAGDVLGPVNEEIRSLVLRHGLQMDYELVTWDIDKRKDQTRHPTRIVPSGTSLRTDDAARSRSLTVWVCRSLDASSAVCGARRST